MFCEKEMDEARDRSDLLSWVWMCSSRPNAAIAQEVVFVAIKAGEWDTVIDKMAFDAQGDIKALDDVVYKWDAMGNSAEINPGDGM